MRAIQLAVACVVVLVATAGQVQAGLMTFEDVPGGSSQGGFGNIPQYQGFNFSFTLYWVDLVGSSYPYGAHSGEFGILNNFGGVGFITEATGADFTFDGLWAKKWATSPESGGADSLSGVLQGYNNGVQVWSVPTSLNGSYEFYGPQAGAIDQLRLDVGDALVDDISLNAGTVAAVPEPSSLALFGIGACVAGLGGARRRRREKQQDTTA